ncbi:hypothetical protein ABPG75_012948 [Micractinium tetrahymenae]
MATTCCPARLGVVSRRSGCSWAPASSSRRLPRAGPPAAGGRLQGSEPEEEGPCTTGRTSVNEWLTPALGSVPAAATLATALLLLPAGAAHASGGDAPPGLLEFIITFIEGLGPWGPAAFVATVALAECIPLFPTQPLSLASGLLFGTQKGALCMLSGTVLASLLAYKIARGVGRPLAERIISHELSGGSTDGGDDAAAGPVQRKLAEVIEAIERGSFWQQAGAVLLLRLTPVVPFSASNYVLGLSPLPLPPFLAGTAAGMAFWSLFYASLGGASRSLLLRGVDPELLVADMMDKAGQYTRELGAAAVVLAAGALLYAGTGLVRRQLGGADSEDSGASTRASDGSNGSASSRSSNGSAASSSGSNGSAGSSGGNGSAAGDAAQKLGRELGRELGAGAGVGRELELAGLRLKEWLGAGAGVGAASPPPGRKQEQLVESHLKD